MISNFHRFPPMKTTFTVIVFLAIFTLAISQCYDVNAGNHRALRFPFEGLRNTTIIEWKSIFKLNSANYLFPESEVNGHRCQTGWNKLYGASRCGFMTHHHSESDRFVWRRPVSCIRFSNGRVIGFDENCPWKNKIEVAAYSYDQKRPPYVNPDLLKPFKTLLDIEKVYSYKIIDDNHQTRFFLSLDGNLLEEQTVKHTQCSTFYRGYYTGLYFGGFCPAPQQVSICYQFK